MRRGSFRGWYLGLSLTLVLTTLLACSIGGSTTGGASTGPTPTPTPIPCATRATATARAWATPPLGPSPQVVGSIGGGPVTTLSHFVYPLGLPNEHDASSSFPLYFDQVVWAPDARHLAVGVALPNPDEAPDVYPFVVDTTTHAVTQVSVPGDLMNSGYRSLAWANNSTLLILTGDTPGNSHTPGTTPSAIYRYDIVAHTTTTLPGITHTTTDGVVRCNTLFYMEVTPMTSLGTDSFGSMEFKGSALLHRYNLTTHTEIGSAITIGDTHDGEGSFGFYFAPGWDAGPLGDHIAYQKSTASLSSPGHPGVQSQFFAANADGSGATQIFGGPNGVATGSRVQLAISPSGLLVALTEAYPTPNIASDSMAAGSIKYYTPDGFGRPAWLADNSGFDAWVESGSSRNVERFLLSTPLDASGRAPGSSLVANASGVASLP